MSVRRLSIPVMVEIDVLYDDEAKDFVSPLLMEVNNSIGPWYGSEMPAVYDEYCSFWHCTGYDDTCERLWRYPLESHQYADIWGAEEIAKLKVKLHDEAE